MKPIDRQDPAWAMFAAAWMSRSEAYALHNLTDESANFADAMIRERDRRDREEFIANHDAELLANVERMPDKSDTELRKAARDVLKWIDRQRFAPPNETSAKIARLRNALEERP